MQNGKPATKMKQSRLNASEKPHPLLPKRRESIEDSSIFLMTLVRSFARALVRSCLSADELNWSHFVLVGGKSGGLFSAVSVEDHDTPLTYQYLIHNMNRDNYSNRRQNFTSSKVLRRIVRFSETRTDSEPFLAG